MNKKGLMSQIDSKRPTSVDIVHDIITSIKPFDELEGEHISDALSWIERGASIFRIQKPDIPDKHLVSYFILFDELAQKVLLVDHINAQLWLPSGGHVEIDEHPHETAARECLEELQVKADFWHDSPLFITATPTVGLTAGHIDVSLWYVLKGNHKQKYDFDQSEFNDISWFGFDEIPYAKADPHMQRFIKKLETVI